MDSRVGVVGGLRDAIRNHDPRLFAFGPIVGVGLEPRAIVECAGFDADAGLGLMVDAGAAFGAEEAGFHPAAVAFDVELFQSAGAEDDGAMADAEAHAECAARLALAFGAMTYGETEGAFDDLVTDVAALAAAIEGKLERLVVRHVVSRAEVLDIVDSVLRLRRVDCGEVGPELIQRDIDGMRFQIREARIAAETLSEREKLRTAAFVFLHDASIGLALQKPKQRKHLTEHGNGAAQRTAPNGPAACDEFIELREPRYFFPEPVSCGKRDVPDVARHNGHGTEGAGFERRPERVAPVVARL